MSEHQGAWGDAIQTLLDLGESRGYLLFDEIDQLLPPEKTGLPEISRLFEFALEDEIDVVASLRDRASDHQFRALPRVPAMLMPPLAEGGELSELELAAAHEAVVKPIVKKFAGRGLTVEELTRAGTESVAKAASRFHRARGYPFAPFAEWFVWQGIQRAVSQSGALTFRIHALSEINEQIRHTRELVEELGRVPSTSEISARAGKPEHRVERIELMLRRFGRVAEFWRHRSSSDLENRSNPELVSVEDAGSRFLTFALEHLPIDLCPMHGRLCPDTQEKLRELNTELHRPGVLSFLGRDLHSLCRLDKGPELVEILLFPDSRSLVPLLANSEVSALLSAWSESVAGASALALPTRTVEKMIRVALFPCSPLTEAVSQRWIDFFSRTMGGTALVNALKSMYLPKHHYAGVTICRIAARDPEALSSLLSAPTMDEATRAELCREFEPVILAEGHLTLLALKNSWVPLDRRQAFIQRLSVATETDPLDLLQLISHGNAVAPNTLAALATSSRVGVSSQRAIRAIREARRFTGGSSVVDAVLAGVSLNVDQAAEFTRQGPADCRRPLGDLVASRVLANGNAREAVSALKNLHLSADQRSALRPIALRVAEDDGSLSDMESLLSIAGIRNSDRIRVAKRCVQLISESRGRSLMPLLDSVAGKPAVERVVRAESRRLAPTSCNSTFIIDVMRIVNVVEDGWSRELYESLVLQAMAHTEDRFLLDRLLALVTPGTPIHRKVADRVVEFHPSHPVAGWYRASDYAERQRKRSVERANTLAALSTASPVQRLTAMLDCDRNAHYWPESWADVDDATIEELSAYERQQLAGRFERGAPVWRELARRLMTTKEKR